MINLKKSILESHKMFWKAFMNDNKNGNGPRILSMFVAFASRFVLLFNAKEPKYPGGD